MDLYATFVNTKDFPETATFVLAWSEFSIEADPDGYAEAVERALAGFDDQIVRTAEVRITLAKADMERIEAALNPQVDAVAEVRDIAVVPAGERL
jgi:hypothetical protein